ncbi:MAG TPA: glycosyltransferase 87 family protein [Mycobacteriales bacterium]|jgi:hypothetical protein|nr:glycosyltransferase 87 family protein [Mycobacteriales bacterium]
MLRTSLRTGGVQLLSTSKRSLVRRPSVVLAAWCITRLPAYLLLDLRPTRNGDVMTYQGWLRFFVHGDFPVSDPRWQYPPGAAAVLSLPHLLPGSYIGSFFRLALVADLAITLVVLAMGINRGSWLGCWLWTLGLPILGSTPLGRFDVFPTLCAVIALSLAGTRFGLGFFGGLGATVKVWPVVVVFAARAGYGWRVLLGVVIGAGGLMGCYLIATTRSLGFIRNQAARGLEIESVGAVPFLWLHAIGLWHGVQVREYGAVDLVGAGIRPVSTALVGATVLALGLLAWWRWRSRWRLEQCVDAALVATMIAVTTSRVLSPQYLIWLLGVAACALASPRSSQRRAAAFLVVAVVFTLIDYPILYHQLRSFGLVAIAVVSLRDLALVAATCAGATGLWRASRGGPGAEQFPALPAAGCAAP